MSRRASAAAALAALAALAVPTFPQHALAHEGNPNFRSDITGIPAGVEARMLNFDDTIQVEVDPGHELIVDGYEDEPYLRYLERRDRRGQPQLARLLPERGPLRRGRDAGERRRRRRAGVGARSARQGTYSWHDHRVHYMAKDVPGPGHRRVGGDEGLRLDACRSSSTASGGSSRARSSGWRRTGRRPVALVGGLAAGVLASLAFAVWRIRKRNAAPSGTGRSRRRPAEAW